jgi:Fe2+ or Zn2+ uptake regulation protein
LRLNAVRTTRDIFAEHKLRCTQQRVAVYEALLASTGHPTADELFQIVKSNTDRLSLATVYNSLEALHSAGLIRKMPMSNGTCRYDSDLHPHLHVRFPATAEIEDVPKLLGERLLQGIPHHVLEEIADELGIRIDGLSIQLLATRADAACDEPGASDEPG